jgi:cellulose synthase (UDP-forming)
MIPDKPRLSNRLPRRKSTVPPHTSWVFALWVFALLCAFYLLSALTDFRDQLVAGAVLLGVMFFTRFNPKNRLMRICFLIATLFLVGRYLLWRTLYTVEFTDWLSFFCAMILYLAEVYGILILVCGLFVNVNPITRKTPPLSDDPDDLPTVDVFVPSYNEDPDLLEVTLLAAQSMEYPANKLNVFLLDDGGTDQKCTTGSKESQASARERREILQALCQEIGVGYLTREKNAHAKAGNLNSALEQTSGEIVMVIDADHVPTRDFLQNTVGFFAEDERLFLVQTPHFFRNPDPIEKNLDTFHQMPSENEMFYRVIQKGLDFWNASFFCGSGALLRRSCLETTGGFSGETITEDCETAITLHSRGYNSVYVERPMLSGLSPETMGGFISQRIRWAQGMTQIFRLKFPLFLRGLTLPQRICYTNTCLFWFFPFARIVYLLAPMAFIFFGLKIYAANWQTFFAYGVPYLIAVFSVSNYLYGKVRWAFVSEVYELIQSVYTLPAIIQALILPRRANFKVTPKGEHLKADFISPLAKPFYFFTMLTIVLIGAAIWRLINSPEDLYPAAITLFWSCVNLVLLVAVLGAMFERRQLRQTPRMPSALVARLETDEHSLPCKVVDLSLGGCMVKFAELNPRHLKGVTSARLVIEEGIDGEPLTSSVIPRNLREDVEEGGYSAGLEFSHKSVAEQRAMVMLSNGQSLMWKDFQRRRDSNLGVIGSFVAILYIGTKCFFAHLAHAAGDVSSSVTGENRKRRTQMEDE